MTAPLAPMQVMLLDDSGDDMLLFDAMLQQEMADAVQLKWCRSIEEADSCLQQSRPDLCLVDYHLGSATNGLSWASSCFSRYGVLGPALLMLTGETDTKALEAMDARAGGDESGIADFLVKQDLTAVSLERAVRYATKQQRLLRAMKLREMQARLFFDHAHEGIVTMDKRGRVTQANRSVERIFGYTEGTMVGLFLSQLVPTFSMELFRPMGADARPVISSRSVHQVVCNNRLGQVLNLEMSLGIIVAEELRFYTANFLDVSAHVAAMENMQQQAQTDDLTGLMNRRHFRPLAEAEMRRALRHSVALSIMMLDIDHFKKVNDHYGHQVGDSVLRAVAQKLKQELREQDLLCRWGGEEFLLLLPGSDIAAAKRLGERIRQGVESLHFAQMERGVTISIGLAAVDPKQRLKVATHAADKALYRAKEAGRNRLCCADGSEIG
ncbi:MAG: diguanylate cyclase [Mariprofundales bacterium]|nr:diguanylate cyclase [Mariprofundales bacterium]